MGTRGTATVTGPQLRRAFGLRDHWINFTTFSSDLTRRKAKKPAKPVPGTAADPVTGGASASSATLVMSGAIRPARTGAWATVERLQGGSVEPRRRRPARPRRPVLDDGSRARSLPRSLRGPHGPRSHPLNTRDSDSATQTGFSPPSTSKVWVSVIWQPPGTSSTALRVPRMRTRAPTGNGAGKRTLS